MKTLLQIVSITFILIVSLNSTIAQNEFITTWKTDNPGNSGNTAITIPTYPGETYNYTVDWGDGHITYNNSGDATHTYSTPGTYMVKITGTFPRIYFYISLFKSKIININQWGNNVWTSMMRAFYGCDKLTCTASDQPNLSNVTDMSEIFAYATSFDSNINDWDVHNVTNMKEMFHFATSFNQPLNDWDVHNVTNMEEMFHDAESFNQPLNNWDVHNVTDMKEMFSYAFSFNQPLNDWDVDNVMDMSGMFYYAASFNQPLNDWNVDNVINMNGMFAITTSFNQPLNDWHVDNVTDMHKMFWEATSFNQNLGDWNIGNVTTMDSMLTNSALSKINYDSTLIGWAAQSVKPNVTLGAHGLVYCYGDNARATLTSAPNNWTISGDVQDCPPFITTWKTDNPGTSSNTAITIPTKLGEIYNYTVDWGDGTITPGETTNASHNYSAAGTYVVKITGTFPRIYFNNSGDKSKIININQWGNNVWTSMGRAFYGCDSLKSTATDQPNLSNVTDMSEMFRNATSFNSNINDWDVHNVTNMSYMFSNAYSFNQPLNNWSVDNVTDMSYMFINASSFNQPLNNWHVTNVTDMSYMFCVATSFNQPLNDWNVHNVFNMANLFAYATSFSQPINNWNVDNVINMTGMFINATSFNQPLNNWHVDNVTDMSWMFRNASSFNQALNNWHVDNVTDMDKMFYKAISFNQNLGDWNIGNVTTMDSMLTNSALSKINYDSTLIGWAAQSVKPNVTLGAHGLVYCYGDNARTTLTSAPNNWTISGDTQNCPPAFITTWDTDKPGTSTSTEITIPTIPGETYSYDVDWNSDLVYDTFGVTGPITHDFGSSGVHTIYIRGTFPGIYFNNSGDKEKILRIDQWGDNQWVSMKNAFYGCTNLTITAIDTPDLSIVTDMSNMFNGASSFNSDIGSWDVSHVTDMSGMFYGATAFDQSFGSWDVSNVHFFGGMFANATSFNKNINNWTPIRAEIMDAMFMNATSFNQPLNSWNVSNVQTMIDMFNGASSFNQSLNSWAPVSVIQMSGMFRDATDFNGSLGGWNANVSNVQDMQSMFNGASAFNQPLNTWVTTSLTNTTEMFVGATSFNQPLNLWDMTNVTDLNGMFAGATDFNASLDGWVFATTQLSGLFSGATSFNQSLDSWDVSNIVNMNGLFDGATSFDHNLGGWDISNVTSMDGMLSHSGLSITNYDSTLTGWANQSPQIQLNVVLGAHDLEYCTGQGARQSLIGTDNWIIQGDSKNCPDYFITTWNTTGSGTSCTSCITIPAHPSGTYNYDVDWENDGIFDDFALAGDITHDYGSNGTYEVAIRGTFPRIYFNDGGDKEKILEINQWGNINWTSMESAFKGCTFLTSTASDKPDLSGVTNMSYMFANAAAFNSDIDDWDVKHVTDMSYLFNGATLFNQDINNWQVDSVTTMRNMFSGATSFDQNINNWDVDNVTIMWSMFEGATSYNKPMNNWNLSNVTDMEAMFQGATSFNQNLGGWNIGNVNYMSNMLNNTALDIPNYDATLIGWESISHQSNVSLGAAGLNYCGGAAARTSLINSDNWTISGDAPSCPFIFTIKTNNPGSSSNYQFTIPTTGGGYNYDVDWNNDGIYDDFNVSGNITHTYDPEGNYTIRIRGDFPRIYFNNSGDKEKILSIDQWGDNVWGSMESAFDGCSHLTTTATDVPDLQAVSTLERMFAGASVFNADISNWDVSNVTNMLGTFFNATAFNQDLEGWNIGSVTNMDGMLSGTGLSLANYDNTLIGWAAQSVQTNVPLGVAGLNYCNGENARNDLISVGWSFDNDSKACPDPFITIWDTDQSGVSGNNEIKIPIKPGESYNYNVDWDNDGIYDEIGITTEVIHGFGAPGVYTIRIQGVFPSIYFANGGDKDKIMEIANWGDIEWSSMENAFYGCTNLTSSAGDTPDLSGVSSMESMFNHAISFDSDVSSWDVSQVTNMSAAFYEALAFNQDLSSWDISNVTNMVEMLSYSGLDLDNYDNTLISWAAQSVKPNVALGADDLKYCAGTNARSTLTSAPENWTILGDSKDCPSEFITTWKTDYPGVSNDSTIIIPTFSGETYLYDVDWGNGTITTDHTGNASYTYSAPGTYTIKITGTFPRIYFNNSLDAEKIININNWGDNPWTSMGDAFYGCINLESSASDKPDLSGVTDISGMFANASTFNSNINDWDVDNVTDMNSMFFYATSFNQPLNNWDVDNVTDMSYMFCNANSFNQPLDSFNVSSAIEMYNMFNSAHSFNQPINSWDVSNVENMLSMFASATSFNQPLDNWDVSNVTNMYWMFADATSFNQNLGDWNIENVTAMDTMFLNTPISISNYDSTLIGWAALSTIQANVALGAFGLKYCAGTNARSILTSAPNNWIITGDSKDCPAEFITTWKTNNPGASNNSTITIPTFAGETYLYDVDWGDGTSSYNFTGDAVYTYSAPGTYMVKISGDFPRIYFNYSGDRKKILNINNWGDIEWSSMENAFYGCENLTSTASDAPDLSNVENMSKMFSFAFLFDADIDFWDVSKVKNMESMFNLATSFNNPLNSWEVDSVTNMSDMFKQASDFNQSLSEWDVDNVTDMSGMFHFATSFNQDLSQWNVGDVTDMSDMFRDATAFNQNLGGWNVGNITTMNTMFQNTPISLINYDSTLIGWAALPTIQNSVALGADGLGYCDGFLARYKLIHDYGWAITGDTLQCPCIWVTNTNDAGTGSLRSALGCSNNGDSILFSPALDYSTINITSSTLNLSHNLSLTSSLSKNITIDASAIDKALHTTSGIDITMEGLKVKCGNSTTTRCLENNGTLKLKNMIFIDTLIGTNGKSIKNNDTINIESNVKIVK